MSVLKREDWRQLKRNEARVMKKLAAQEARPPGKKDPVYTLTRSELAVMSQRTGFNMQQKYESALEEAKAQIEVISFENACMYSLVVLKNRFGFGKKRGCEFLEELTRLFNEGMPASEARKIIKESFNLDMSWKDSEEE